MSSIMTNVSAMTALQTLRSINQDMETTQARISTGYRVGTAEDNAAYWSIATTMRSDNQALSAVNDALGLGAATVDVAYTGMESAIDVANEIKAKLVAARQPGVDKSKIQTELTELQNQLKATADSANFNGQNWLSVDSSAGDYAATKSIVSGFTRTGSTVSVTTTDVDTSTIHLYDANGAGTGILDEVRTATGGQTYTLATLDITDFDGAGAEITDTELDSVIQGVETALASMTDAATNLGSTKMRVGLQQDFIDNLQGAIERGVGQLVDADMNDESTRLKALQTQQQLGIQALSIANSNSQNILSLFR